MSDKPILSLPPPLPPGPSSLHKLQVAVWAGKGGGGKRGGGEEREGGLPEERGVRRATPLRPPSPGPRELQR